MTDHDRSVNERLDGAAAQLAAEALPAFRDAAPFRLAFLTDSARLQARGVALETILAQLPARTGVIFRDYQHEKRAQKAAALAALCRERALLLFVAGDEALARDVGAQGLHAPAAMAARLKEKPRGLMLSVACHSSGGLKEAARLEADCAFLSPAFETASHPDGAYLGPARFKALAQDATVPVLALGGVTPANAGQLSAPAVIGFGAIDAFIEGALENGAEQQAPAST